MVQILICDDQEMVREGLTVILSHSTEIQVLAAVSDGTEALDFLERAEESVDVVLMDLKMPLMNGVLATRKIKESWPNTSVLILTTFDADDWVFDAIRAGACGYILKDSPSERIVEAVLGAARGESHLAPTIAGKLMDAVAGKHTWTTPRILQDLTSRELEVLDLLALGMTNAQIASKLFLSEGTVRNYLSVVFEKLQVDDRTQAAILAVRFGLGDARTRVHPNEEHS